MSGNETTVVGEIDLQPFKKKDSCIYVSNNMSTVIKIVAVS